MSNNNYFEIKDKSNIPKMCNFLFKHIKEFSLEVFSFHFCKKNNHALVRYENGGNNSSKYFLANIIGGELIPKENINKNDHERLSEDFDFHISYAEHLITFPRVKGEFILRIYANDLDGLCTLSSENFNHNINQSFLDFFQPCDPKKYTPLNLIKITKGTQ